MKKYDIERMILSAKQVDRVDLSQRHGLDRLTKADVLLLAQLLREDHRSITYLALEDLTVSDEEAEVLAALVKDLPLSYFSLQGLKLGDRCAKKLCTALSESTGSEGEPAEQFPASHRLKVLVVGGLAATDACLDDYQRLLTHNPILQRFSLNWSNHFSVARAWQLVLAVAIHNLSLVKNDIHGFFHTFERDMPAAIEFMDGVAGYVIKRNAELLVTPQERGYRVYCHYLNKYNETLAQNFGTTQKLYGLVGEGRAFACPPLSEQQFLHRWHKLSQQQREATPSGAVLTVSLRDIVRDEEERRARSLSMPEPYASVRKAEAALLLPPGANSAPVCSQGANVNLPPTLYETLPPAALLTRTTSAEEAPKNVS